MNRASTTDHHIILVVDDLIPSASGASGDKDLLNLFSALSELPYRIIFAHTRHHPNHEYQNQLEVTLRLSDVQDVIPATNEDELKNLISQIGEFVEFAWIRRASNFMPFWNFKAEKEWSPKLIADFVDLHFLRFKRAAYYLDPCQDLLALAMANFQSEKFALLKCDTAVCISRFEETLLRKLAPEKKIHFVPICRETVAKASGKAQRPNENEPLILGFIGSFDHAPNLVSINHFIESIFPDLTAQYPQIKLLIAGRGSTPQQVGPAISCLGELESTDEFYSRIDIAIAPLLFGAGQKGKVLEALAYGKPVITSSIAAEGLEDPLLDSVVIADNKQQYLEYLRVFFSKESDHSLVFSQQNSLNLLSPTRFKTLIRETILGLMQTSNAIPLDAANRKIDLSFGNVRRIGTPGDSLHPMYSIVSEKDYISTRLVEQGFFDAALNNLIQIFSCDLRSGSVVVDVGANVGSFAIPMALMRHDVEVIAFEPQLIPFCQLCSSLIDNSAHNINPIRAAVGDVADLIDLEKAALKIPVADHLDSMNMGGFSLDPEVLSWKLNSGEVRISESTSHFVQLFSLDQLYSKGFINKPVSMIKVDVEGMEISVLRGAKELIKNNMPILIYKGWSSDYAPQFKDRVKEVDSFIVDFGYRIARFGELRVAIPKLI